MEEHVTPMHLFIGKRSLNRDTNEPYVAPKDDDSAEDIKVRAKKVGVAVDRFWKRWTKEYLLELRQHHTMHQKKKTLDAKKGDVVLIHEDNVKRRKWNLGVIDEVIVGRDGAIRGATVRKIGGDGSKQIIQRPVQKLYPLEISSSVSDDVSSNDGQEVEPDVAGNDNNDGSTIENEHEHVNNENENRDIEDVDNDSKKTESIVPTRTTTSTRRAAIDGELRRRLNDDRINE